MKSPVCYPCRADAIPPPTAPDAFSGDGRRQAGVALITVLLIVFLASVTATSLAALQQMTIRRSTVLQHQQQARLYTLGVEQWMMLILARDRKQSETDHPGEQWANLPPALPIKDGVLSGRLRDQQGCFNLNNLWQSASSTPSTSGDTNEQNQSQEEGQQTEDQLDQEDQNQTEQDQAEKKTKQSNPTEDANQSGNPTEAKDSSTERQDSSTERQDSSATDGDSSTEAKSGKAQLDEAQFQVLQRLLTSLELKPELAQAIVDWLDPDQDPLFPDGAEDSDYNVLTPPYLAANRPLTSVSELRLIKGVDQETYDKLAPLVCALPPGTSLNVNTAPATVLAALSEGQDIKNMEQLLENRPEDGYKQVDDFLNAAKLTVDARLKARLGVDSRYFSLRAEARVGDGRAMLYSILYRDKNGVRVLRRSFGNQD